MGLNIICNEMKPLSKEHFKYIKGIAILAVIVAHVGNFSGRTWFTPLGGIGVALFLFCSGYGLLTSYYQKGLKGFWRNKLISIYLPFAFVEIIAAIIYRHPFLDVLLNLVFIKRLNPLGWYMQYLAVCYILFYVVVWLVSNRSIRFLIWGIAAGLSYVLCPNLQAEQAISFIGGLLLAEMNHAEKLSIDKRKTVCIGGVAIIVSIGLLAIKQLPFVRAWSHYLITLLNLLLKSGAAMGVICITSIWQPMWKAFMWMGKLSYSLYLVHGYFMPIIDKQKFGNFYVSSVAMLLLSFVVAIGLNAIVGIFNKRKEKCYDTKSISNQQ